MSALTLKGPHWVTVRQHRRALWVAGAAVALSLVCVGGLRFWDSLTPGTNQDNGYALLRWGMEYFSAGMILLPLLVGAFVAGPMVARELESGTYKLALGQSVAPSRWLGAKLLTAATATVVITAALTAVYQVGLARVDGAFQLHWSDRGPYEASGTVLLAQCMLAIAVGALVGQLVRRTVPAMAVTGIVVGLPALLLGAFRWDFLSPRTITGPIDDRSGILVAPDDAFTTAHGLLAKDGGRMTDWPCWRYESTAACVDGEGLTGQYVDYHPASHFWPTQLIETGIVLALAALALYAAFRVLRARHP
ncbi:ABC transporter permease [Streptomyces sp. NPDC056527]|uniref:ABC transporter permease n=1 Tax=Streptomyces sp. NPDC056527 TaxID=3345853 RepID=UPI003695F024